MNKTHGTDTKSRTMGSSSSRKILCESGEHRKDSESVIRRVGSFFKVDRLVRDELRQDVQPNIREQKRKICDSVPFIQKQPKSLQ